MSDLVMEIPRAAWDIISQLLAMNGHQDRQMITVDLAGNTTTGIEMNGIMIVPIREDDSDTIVNSGRLVDYLVQAGEEAFLAGYEAGCRQGVLNKNYLGGENAWGRYTPSDALQELQDNL